MPDDAVIVAARGAYRLYHDVAANASVGAAAVELGRARNAFAGRSQLREQLG